MRKHLEGVLWLIAACSLMLGAPTSARSLLLVISIVWAVAMVAVIPLHFYRAWGRFRSVPNPREYAVWVGFETVFAVGLVAGFASMVSSR